MKIQVASCYKLWSNQTMDFGAYVDQIETLYCAAGGLPASDPSPLSSNLGPTLGFIPKQILIIPPHPDDECLMSGFALRAKLETGAEVGVLPFSYGSKVERRSERKLELRESMQVLGFVEVDDREWSGHSDLSESGAVHYLKSFGADALVIPHAQDFHPTHERCHRMMLQAAREYVKERGAPLQVFETEYWHSMDQPNLRIPLSSRHVETLGLALMKHKGEVSRNPYHLTLPAFFMDQERKGREIVHGLGGSVSEFSVFSQLYRTFLVGPDSVF